MFIIDTSYFPLFADIVLGMAQLFDFYQYAVLTFFGQPPADGASSALSRTSSAPYSAPYGGQYVGLLRGIPSCMKGRLSFCHVHMCAAFCDVLTLDAAHWFQCGSVLESMLLVVCTCVGLAV